MTGEDRRENLLDVLERSAGPITGSDLSRRFDVSRQVIVQDIALLRARGENILATSQGYLAPQNPVKNTLSFTVACQHTPDEVEDELITMVNYGARILDVIVEHPIYGELRGILMIQSPEDVKNFINKYRQEEVTLLSSLTDGVHLHTVEVMNRQVMERLKEALLKKGYLLAEDRA